MPSKTHSKKVSKAEQYNQNFYKTVGRLASSRNNPFTVDDVVAKIGNPPQGRNALGPLMNAAANRHDLEFVGYRPSETPSRRMALVAEWLG